MVERRRNSRLPGRDHEDLIRQFCAGSTARTATDLVGVNRDTATLYFHKLRELIVSEFVEKEAWLSGEIEVDESYFGGSRVGKRGRGAAGKVPVFGLLKRGEKVHVVIIPNIKQKYPSYDHSTYNRT